MDDDLAWFDGARSAQAVMLRLHGANRTDLVAGEFAAPAGGRAEELYPDRACSQHLTIVQPDPDSHVWRNPETPPGAFIRTPPPAMLTAQGCIAFIAPKHKAIHDPNSRGRNPSRCHRPGRPRPRPTRA
jgi:hypothetical protein